MPESDAQAYSEPELTDVESLHHEPIMQASGSRVSERLILLVAGIILTVVLAATIFAYTQGIFTHPNGSYF
jgi:hypothetical protein